MNSRAPHANGSRSFENMSDQPGTDSTPAETRDTSGATIWEHAVGQTCVIHLLRDIFRYASRKYWDQISKDIRPVYTAPTEAAAKERFTEFHVSGR